MLALTTLLWSKVAAQDTKDDDYSMGGDFADNPGLWSALVIGDQVHIQFGGHHWSSGASFALSEVGGAARGQTGIVHR